MGEISLFEKRVKGLGVICFFLLFMLSIRLMYIGIYSGKTLETMAQKQQERKLAVKHTRGAFLDRNEKKITDAGDIKLYLTDKGEISDKHGNDNVWEFNIKKRFPDTLGHLIGYTDIDSEGKSGLEALYNDVLKTDGKTNVKYMADAFGNPAHSYSLEEEKSKTQTDIKLTLDVDIQKIVYNVMKKHIKKGAAVVLDIESFDVLSMVSLPDFNEDKIESYTASSDGELLNRALMGYNAGSVFKIITAAATLEKAPEFVNRTFDCRGSYDLYDGHIFACHKKEGHGVIGFKEAFAKSCNCSFYIAGLETGAQNIISLAEKMGIGKSLLDIGYDERCGNLPKRSIYSNAETLNICIGQGEILVTPLHCAVIAATVANRGKLREVNLVDSFINKEGSINKRKSGEYELINEETARVLSDMMRECVLSGTASYAADSKTNISGKTGSAESGWIKDGSPLVHGWFCGFFPYENPKYAMAILSEGGRSGAGSCVVPFVEIAEEINKIYPVR